MRVSMEMFGNRIDLGDVPDRKKRKYRKRKRAKALFVPRKDKMVKTSINKEV